MGSTPKAEGSVSRSRVTMLEEEGEVAADYLEEFLDIADLDGDIEIDVEHGRAALAIVADDNSAINHLVGRDGSTLEALQELTRLAVQAKTGERSRLMLDIAGFRAQRKVELGQLAKDAIAKVEASGEPLKLDPLNAFERKVVHDVVTAAGLISESHGVDPNRYIEITPAK
ncbi:R3H domain-containing nucleic acid-binding protein [Jonesiaceae bacterium BS-20]|uniref:R3H domain-containing nucleic acid-binding protein n=1 Tax=Jonesiaceae bacterium BS-20 TaxID=3120821 RepID=A0AAU7DW50_9MICO